MDLVLPSLGVLNSVFVTAVKTAAWTWFSIKAGQALKRATKFLLRSHPDGKERKKSKFESGRVEKFYRGVTRRAWRREPRDMRHRTAAVRRNGKIEIVENCTVREKTDVGMEANEVANGNNAVNLLHMQNMVATNFSGCGGDCCDKSTWQRENKDDVGAVEDDLYRKEDDIQHKDTPIQHKDTPIQHKDTPIQHKDTPIQHKDTPIQQMDTPRPCHTTQERGGHTARVNLGFKNFYDGRSLRDIAVATTTSMAGSEDASGNLSEEGITAMNSQLECEEVEDVYRLIGESSCL